MKTERALYIKVLSVFFMLPWVTTELIECSLI
jgi:hypothetical protein